MTCATVPGRRGGSTISTITHRHDLTITRIRVNLKLPYKNQLTPSPGLYAFRRYCAVRSEWDKAIPVAPGYNPAEVAPPLPPGGPRKWVQVTRIMTKRERRFDLSNIWYSIAALLDALVKRGHLRDDNDQDVDVRTPIQRQALPDEIAPSTLIEIGVVPAITTPVLDRTAPGRIISTMPLPAPTIEGQ